MPLLQVLFAGHYLFFEILFFEIQQYKTSRIDLFKIYITEMPTLLKN
jgi:hypothetical protein